MSGACPGPGGWRANLAPTYTNIPDWKFLVVLKTFITLMQMCLIRV